MEFIFSSRPSIQVLIKNQHFRERMTTNIRTHRRNKAVQHNEDHFRQSVPFEGIETVRNSLAPHYEASTYRSSDITNMVINPTTISPKTSIKQTQMAPKGYVKQPNSSLIFTLKQLEVKLVEAKKQLAVVNKNNSYDSFFELKTLKHSSESESRADDDYFIDKAEESTINLESQKMLIRVMRSKERLVWASKIKTYYVAEIAKGMAGINERAMQHLNISLEILKSCKEVQLPDQTQIKRAQINIAKHPDNFGKKTLVLDLDQTLFHCDLDRNSAEDIEIELQNDGSMVKAYVSIRPYAISFLKKACKHFEIIAFTASERSYADTILNQIDPDNKLIHHRLYREHCVKFHNKVYAKDLTIIGRDLSHVILVDNSPLSYLYQIQNGVPILPYYGGEDTQLLSLQKYLDLINKQRDVRHLNRSTFKLCRYGQFQQCQELVRQLYFQGNDYY